MQALFPHRRQLKTTMMKFISTLYLFSLILFFSADKIFAQVTIGSTVKPSEGALLDLKEEGVTTKGLVMPRVKITNLHPTSNSELGNSIGSSESFGMQDHIGLTVYNVADDPICPTIPSGLYVWDGSKWTGLGIENIVDRSSESFNETTGLGSVTDYEGNVYPTKRFKSADGIQDGGIWMTKNLLSIRKSDGTYIGCADGLQINPALYNSNEAVVVKASIPEGVVGNYINADNPVSGQSYSSFAKEFGLEYTWQQAMAACPRGWHLPSDAEWNLLAQIMGGTKGVDQYLDIGDQMKANNNTFYKGVDWGSSYEWGTDNSVIENGFNALPAGFSYSGSGIYASANFSVTAYWWSSDKVSWSVNGNNSSLAYFNFYEPGLYHSVRCIRD